MPQSSDGITYVDYLRYESMLAASVPVSAFYDKDDGHVRATLPENLVAKLAGGKIDEAWVDEVIKRTGLEDRRTHRPSELSGGQQQRVAIARALATRPTVIFADEPTGNLDSHTSAEILDLVREMVTNYGQTTVMVTHDAHAAAIADRVLFLADGCIVKELRGADAGQILSAMEEVSRR